MLVFTIIEERHPKPPLSKLRLLNGSKGIILYNEVDWEPPVHYGVKNVLITCGNCEKPPKTCGPTHKTNMAIVTSKN